MSRIKLNKKNRGKVVRLLKNSLDNKGKPVYNNSKGEPYTDLKASDITLFIVYKHKITQEILDKYIELI